MTTETFRIPADVEPLDLLGMRDNHLRMIDAAFEADVSARGNEITVESDDESQVGVVTGLLADLVALARRGEQLTDAVVEQSIEAIRHGEMRPAQLHSEVITTYRGKAVRPKTAGQKRYIDTVRSHTITFGIGPAGTGKTYLAMALAVEALKRKEVSRLILTRPAVEAGENLGFLPGTLTEKVDPYLRPLYDALLDMMDPEKSAALVEKGVIEIAPLAFMRGRTLNDSFVILDEAQNTTTAQMKMFLTRLGFNGRMVVTGDATQVDLPRGRSGLVGIEDILGNVKDVGFSYLTGKDVVRHRLVQRIVEAYRVHEAGAEQLELPMNRP